MKIRKILFLIIIVAVISCNKTAKNDKSVSLNKKSTLKNNYSEISLTVDSKKTCNYYFNKSEKLIKVEEFLSNGELDHEINLEYKDNKFNFVFLGTDKNLKDEWFSNYYSNIELYNDFLIKKNIKIDNPFMLANEVSDIQNLLANIGSFQKSKNKNQIIFQSKKVNLKIGFAPSTITRFIPQNSVISYFEYILDNNRNLTKETIMFDDGVLTIKYFYKKHKINKITYSLRYNNGEILVSNKNYIFLFDSLSKRHKL